MVSHLFPFFMSASAPASLFRYALCVLSLLSVVPAAAQMRDVENAAPRVVPMMVETSVGAAALAAGPATLPGELLHELANLLELRPDQVAVVRRALAITLATPTTAATSASAADEALHLLLTETQLARLQQWEAALPCAERANLVATLR